MPSDPYIFGWFRTVRLGETENGRENNLNLIRFLLASAVILSHSYGLLRLDNEEPMERLLHFGLLGTTAVYGFFFISGYLILKSALRANSVEEYLAARSLRIFPGLVVVAFLTAFVLGPLASTVPARQYFGSQVIQSFFQTIFLRPYQSPLPGLFEHNPVAREINGALWTLPGEWMMYVVVLLVCLTFQRKPLGKMGLRGGLMLAGCFALTSLMMPLPWSNFFVLTALFGIGSLCYVFRSKILLSLPVAVLALLLDGVLIRFAAPHLGKRLFPATFAYFILAFGYHPAVHVKAFHRFGDYSYGLYIYGWPMQQLLIQHFHEPGRVFAASYPCTLLAAILSWHYVEKPSLALKNRIKRAERLKNP